MYQYTTPSITFELRDLALADGDNVWVSIESQVKVKGDPDVGKITIEDPDVTVEGSNTVVSCRLTQEQSASLPEGRALVQVNYLTADGIRDASPKVAVKVERNLLGEVKVYEVRPNE